MLLAPKFFQFNQTGLCLGPCVQDDSRRGEEKGGEERRGEESPLLQGWWALRALPQPARQSRVVFIFSLPGQRFCSQVTVMLIRLG